MHYYKFNIGDYSSATQHLEPMEDLAYRRMLDLYYQKESPLPLDPKEIARLIRMRSQCDCIESVLREFFTKEKDGWHNKGADKALGKVYLKSEAARLSAQARWSKNKGLTECGRNADASETQCEHNANGMLPITQDPLPKTHEKEIGSASEPATPKKRSKKKALTDFPVDFFVDEEMSKWYFEQDGFVLDLGEATQSWADGVRAKGYQYADWKMAWRNGVKNQNKWAKERMAK